MFYKLLFIFILNVLLGQSFFNKAIGNEIGFQSARSLAIGQTHFMNSNTSNVSLRNPARLGLLNIKTFTTSSGKPIIYDIPLLSFSEYENHIASFTE